MLKFCDRNKGAISVFLTLILLPVLLLGGLTVDAARIYASKVVISDAGDLVMNAALAQYQKELHDEYGLFVMEKDPEFMESQLEELFNRSLNGSGLPDAEEYDKILDLVTEQFDAINLAGSEIYRTEVEKQQIVEYMKYRAPVCLTELILEKMTELKDTKKMAEAMEAQMDFAEAMENCQDYMEEAKVALDALHNLIESYPQPTEIEEKLGEMEGEYKTRVSRCILMLAVIAKYTEFDQRNDAEESAKSYVAAAAGVDTGEYADSPESFNGYLNCLYYGAGEQKADKDLREVIKEHRENEPDEDDSEYSDWEDRMDELEELKDSYDAAKASVVGYENQLYYMAYNEVIIPRTEIIHGYWEMSKTGAEYADTAYKKLQKVKEELKNAKEKWNNWSQKTNELEAIEAGKSGEMKKSVEEYGDFFEGGDEANNLERVERLMEDVKTDSLYFNEMRDILTDEQFWELPIATTPCDIQYNTYLQKAIELSGGLQNYDDVDQTRANSYATRYHPAAIETNNVKERIGDDPFYKKLIEYCKDADTPESQEKKNEANEKLNDSKNAGKEAESEEGFPTYHWTMDANMPSVALGLVAPDGAKEGMTSLGGNVNNKNGRKDAISKFKTSISEATSFLDGLDRIVSNNLENLYVAEYAMQMFSYYTIDKKNGNPVPEKDIISLSGYELKGRPAYRAEVEYILWGNSSSAINITATMMTIFGIRMLFNSFFAFTNTRIVSTSRNMAVAIAGAAPYLVPVVQVLIELGFAGIETADDMIKIKDGYAVTILKAPQYWRTFATNGMRNGNNTDGVGLNYSEYLRIFLNLNMLDGKEIQKLARIADCIRLNTGYDMIHGYTMLAIEAKVKARTTFMKTVSDMSSGGWANPDNTYKIRYQSILGY